MNNADGELDAPGDALRHTATARQQWIGAMARTLQRDRRVAGAWLVGSIGSGTHDPYSDVDIVVSMHHAAAQTDPRGWLSRSIQQVLFDLRVPRNAPAGGAYHGLCLKMAGLPVWTDWYLWPAPTAAVPAGASILLHHRNAPLQHTSLGFMALLDGHRTTAREKADRCDPRFRLLAILLAIKYLARADTGRLHHMLALLGRREPDRERAEVVLRAALEAVRLPEMQPAVMAVSRLLDLATAK